MTHNFKNILKVCSFALVVSCGFNASSYAKSSFISYEPSSFITLTKSEWRRGQDNIALGDRLIRKGEFDMASGHRKLGREEIEQGRDMKERGREQVREFRDDRDWYWKGHPFRQW